ADRTGSAGLVDGHRSGTRVSARVQQVGSGRRGAPRSVGARNRPRAGPGAVGAAGQYLSQDGTRGAEVGAGDGDVSGVVGHPHRDGSTEHLGEGSGGRDAAACARRQAAADSVRDTGHGQAADVRAVHKRISGGRLSAVPRAAASRDIRLRGQPDPDQRPSQGEAQGAVPLAISVRKRALSAVLRTEIGQGDSGRVSVFHMALIAVAGVAAGAINAIVGSGTLITFPTLVTLGFPPVTSTMSNAVGLVAGSTSGTWGYRRELRGQWHRLRWQLVALLTGSVLGSWLLLHLPEQVFTDVVPVLLVAALVLVVIGPRIQEWARRRAEKAGHAADHVPAGRMVALVA